MFWWPADDNQSWWTVQRSKMRTGKKIVCVEIFGSLSMKINHRNQYGIYRRSKKLSTSAGEVIFVERGAFVNFDFYSIMTAINKFTICNVRISHRSFIKLKRSITRLASTFFWGDWNRTVLPFIILLNQDIDVCRLTGSDILSPQGNISYFLLSIVPHLSDSAEY